jgi:hypothetical protein
VLQGHAERARDQLQSALLHLQLEPPLSPEGRLHQLALQELATLEASLQEPPHGVHGQGRPQPRPRNKGHHNK